MSRHLVCVCVFKEVPVTDLVVHVVTVTFQVAQDKDADISSSDEMGVIPAGTLLKTEFSAVIPEASSPNKVQVGP